MRVNEHQLLQIVSLCKDIHRDVDLLLETLVWSLEEERIRYLTPPEETLREMKNSRNCKELFWKHVEEMTNRSWTYEEVEKVWDRVSRAYEKFARQPIRFEDALRLYWTTKEECAHCHKKPPEVKLQIDHNIPVSKGGSSGYDNLQFLCGKCNMEKSNKYPRSTR